MRKFEVTRRARLAVIVIALIAVGFMAVRYLSHGTQGWHAAPTAAKEEYYCPMHPGFVSDKPGDCPVCYMKLVKRKEGSSSAQAGRSSEEICVLHNCAKLHEGRPCAMMVIAAPGEKVVCPVCGTYVVSEQGTVSSWGYSAVLLSPQKRQMIGLKTAPVVKRAMTKTIRTVGQIAYDPRLYQAQQEYLQALKASTERTAPPAVIEQSRRLVEAARVRLRTLGLGEDFIKEMEKWEGPDETLLLTGENGQVWLYAPVYEFELPLVHAGQRVSVEVPSVPGKTLEGIVRSVDPILDPMTRTARVRAVLTDPQRFLRPGFYVNAFLTADIGEVLGIPEEAVLETGARRIVFVDKGQGVLEPRQLNLGFKADGFYEVKSGLAEGELVVTGGNFLLDSESRLKAVLQGMTDGGEGDQHRHGQ
ncbi:MAG: efflux RND transporter periplasmic adaptor subunit [Candidatus Omnitrophica bacterium]|nr:efflux RND transporter periplasmic adaptor subunit [Candidatus Omnitrophota bacterium]